MKALLVDQYRDVGGGQTVFLQILRSLVSAGIETEALFPLGGELERAVRGSFGASVRCRGIQEPQLTSGTKSLSDVLGLAKYSLDFLGKKRELEGFDLIYVNGPRLFPSFLALSSVIQARFVYHLHLDHSLPEKLLVAALLQHPRTHAVVVNSDFVLKRLRSSLGPLAVSSKLKLVENSLSRNFSELSFVDRWKGELHAIIPGRVVPEKGQDRVIGLATQFPLIRFHVLGDADFGARNFLDKLKADAPANVVFHGYVSEMNETISKIGAQLSLIPSRWEEPFGLTAIESMACSCLTLVSGRGGLHGIAEKTGAWICEGTSDFEKALKKIQETSREDLAAQTRAQHEKTMKHYSAERFERETLELFKNYS